MGGFLKANDERTDITEKEVELSELFNNVGINYRRKTEPEKISITTKPKFVSPSQLELFYSDGNAEEKEVPAGTILSNDKTIIPEDYFSENYEPYVDEEGNVIEGMYIRVVPVTIIKNPYNTGIVKTNANGWIMEEGDANCFIIYDGTMDRYGYSIITKEQVEERFVPYSIDSKNKKNVK